MNRQACIIAAGEWGGHRALLKNRDRNYTPQLTLVHEIRAGVEVAYVRDEVTGWCEGLNARGLGVVNAALAVGVDEAEVKLVKTLGKKSRDGERIVKALEQRSLDEALAVLRTYKGGLKGHTFVSTPQRTVSLEQLSEEKAHPAPVDADEDGDYAVRTNHGIHYADVGYTEGTGYVSSVVRKERATTALAAVGDPFGLAPTLMAARDENRGDPNNMVRDTARMSTTSQLVLDLTARELHLFLIPGKCSYEGARVELPAGRRPAIKTRVYTYREGGTALVELDPKTGAEVGDPRPVRPSAERVARRFSQTP